MKIINLLLIGFIMQSVYCLNSPPIMRAIETHLTIEATKKLMNVQLKQNSTYIIKFSTYQEFKQIYRIIPSFPY